MKRLLMLMITLTIVCGSSFGQRYLPRMQGVSVRGGYVPNGFYGGLGFSQYAAKKNRWVCDVEMLYQKYTYDSHGIPLAQFTASGGYYISFFDNAEKSLFMSIGASAMAGYETINWGESLLPDGARLESRDSFVWGGAITLETEYYMTDNMVLLVNVRQRILGGSTVNLFKTQVGIGVKLILSTEK